MASASSTTSETTAMEVQTSGQPTTTIDAVTTAGARASGRAAGANRPPVELKKWHGVALWRYQVEVEDCAICKANITEPCTNCQADATTVDDANCPVAWGRCNHVRDLSVPMMEEFE